MLPSPSTSGQQVPLRTAPPFRNPLWISRLLSALLFLQRAEGQLLSLEKLGQTALACLKQHSIKQTQEPTRVSSLLETALKHTIQRGHGILSTHPTPRSHILEHSVWDTSENECDQIPLVISSWGQVESFAFSLSLGCDCTKSQSPVLPDAATHCPLPNALGSYRLLTHPRRPFFYLSPFMCSSEDATHIFFIPQRDESVEWLQTAGEAEAARAELSWSLPQFLLKAT